jgi:hypothetical protein
MLAENDRFSNMKRLILHFIKRRILKFLQTLCLRYHSKFQYIAGRLGFFRFDIALEPGHL